VKRASVMSINIKYKAFCQNYVIIEFHTSHARDNSQACRGNIFQPYMHLISIILLQQITVST